MLHRILGIALVVCGVVAGALGVASATVWRTSPTVTATTTPATSATLVTTAPGVLDLVDDAVRVTATSPAGGTVVLAVGRADDVTGWVGEDPVQRVVGLSTWNRLATSTVAGEAPEKAPDPSGSDMWLQEVTGEGSATLALTDVPTGVTLLAAGVGDDASAPALSLTWTRAVATPYLWPLLLAGLALVVVGAAVLLLGRARAQARRQQAARDAVRRPAPADDPGASGDAPGGPSLTRRELREQAERIAREDQRKGRARRGRPEPAAPEQEAPPETVAIPVPQEALGAADAWRRRWNVPARIPPADELFGDPGDPGDPGAPDGPRPAPGPEQGAPAAPRTTAPWSPTRPPGPRPWDRSGTGGDA